MNLKGRLQNGSRFLSFSGCWIMDMDSLKYFRVPQRNWIYTFGKIMDVYGDTLSMLRPGKNGHHSTDNIFRLMFLNNSCCILIQISFKVIPWGADGSAQNRRQTIICSNGGLIYRCISASRRVNVFINYFVLNLKIHGIPAHLIRWTDHPTSYVIWRSVHFDKKCQGYVYVKCMYWNTMQKIKHYLIYENRVNENKVLSYCEALRYMWNNRNQQKMFSVMPNLQTH